MCRHSSVLDALIVSCVSPLGADTWKLHLVSSRLTHVPFLFSDFILYPFTIINHSHEYDYILCPVSSPSKSNLGVVLGIPNIELL